MNEAEALDKTLPAGAGRPASSPVDRGGAAPGGMWWVAWRQHRTQIAVTLVLLTAAAAGIVAFRLVLLHQMATGALCSSADLFKSGDRVLGCAQRVFEVADGQFVGWGILQVLVAALSVLLGAFLGAPLFAREFEQRTQVFALTQSISRVRWAAVKSLVIGGPAVLGMVAIGLLMDWTYAPFAQLDASPMSTPNFETRGLMPAVFTLLSFAIAVTVGLFLRSTVPTLVVCLLFTTVVIAALAVVRPHIAPSERTLTPPSNTTSATLNTGDWFLATGQLDTAGREVNFDGNCPPRHRSTTTSTQAQRNQIDQLCFAEQHIANNYQDYVPAARQNLLQIEVAGITTAIAALTLLLGVSRIRRAAL